MKKSAQTERSGTAIAAGGLLADRFEILRELGAGGFGSVFEVLDHASDERLALKELRSMDAASLYRFKQEFRSLADISHPNLVALRELHGAGDRWFFTMELVEGRDFSSHMRPSRELATAETVMAPSRSNLPTVEDPFGPQPIGQWPLRSFELEESHLRSALVQLVRGVMALHAAGKVHCDLKPSNVLIDASGRLVILDFGLVADAHGAGLEDHLQLAGTPVYMSPEHVRGVKLGPASDWYSVGIMLFEALTGFPPHEGDSITDVLSNKLLSDVPDPRLSTVGIPNDLADMCVELTRLDPTRRAAGDQILKRLEQSAPATAGAPDERSGSTLEALAMLGRRAQLEALHSAHCRLVLDRSASTLQLHGASGMGKTALLRHFASEVRASGTIVLEGRCFERETVAYNAFDSLIDALTHRLASLRRQDVEPLLPPDVHALARLFPVLENVAAIAERTASTPAAPDPQRLRARAFRALRALLDRLARRAPLVVVIDDLHWADADSAALLEDLLREPDPPALLLVASYRTEAKADSPMLETLSALPGNEVELGPLSFDDACQLAAGLLGEARSRLPLARIAKESGGNPLFVSELVRHALAGAPDAGESRAVEPESLTLDGVLGARVDRLPAPARRLLQVVAIMGEPIAQASALEAAGVNAARHETLALLRRGDLIKRSAGSAGDRIELFHDRVRNAVLGRLAEDERRGLHLELARSLSVSERTDPEAVARHFRQGGHPLRALEYARLAAERASAALAFDRAVALYRVALELAPSGGRAELQLRLADALVNAGRGAEAAEAYLAAVTGSDRQRNIDLRRKAAEHFLRSGRIDQGVATLRAVLDEVGIALPATPSAVLISLVAGRLRLRLRGLDVRLRDEREIAPDLLLKADSCASAALGLSMVDVIRGSDFQTRQLLLALDAGEPVRIAVALALNAAQSASAGARGRARARVFLARASELAAPFERPYVDALVRAASGVCAFVAGRFLEARAELASAERIFRDRCVGTDFHRVTVQLFSIAACFYAGELAELTERVSRDLLEAEQRGDLYASVNLQLAAGNMAWLVRDQPDQARARASDALAAWSRDGYLLQHWYALRSLAQIDLYQGHELRAYLRTKSEWRALNRSLIARSEHIFVETRQLFGRVALAAASNPLHAHALSEAERASKQLRRVGEPWSICFALLLDAGAALCRGDRARAERLLRLGITRCESAGLYLYAAAARARLGELVGGSMGGLELERADAFLQKQGVQAPERFARMLVPGRLPGQR